MAASAAESFTGGGEAGALIRSTDWSRTPLGPVERWPASLIAHVRAMLHMRQPMSIFWGPELVNLYNDGFLPILGEKHPGAFGQVAREVWRDAWPVVGAQIERVLQGENVYFEEMLVPIERGSRLQDAWWNYSYSPLFDDAGATAGVLVICTEVTNEVLQRRRTEAAKREAELAREELRGVFMQAPVPMVIFTGAEHRLLLANPPYLELVAGRDVIGRTAREVFSEAEAATFVPVMDRVFRTGAPETLSEAAIERPDANAVVAQRLVDAGYHPHRDASGAIAGVLVVIHDVTRPVLQRRQLEVANRAKDEFLAMLGHELRNPLAPITTALQLIKHRGDGTLEREREVIERQVNHMTRLVDDLLDISRITRGKVRLDRQPIGVMTAIAKGIEMAEPLIEARGHHLDVRIPEHTIWVDADATRLSQVVANLLTNAARYTAPGGHIAVEARREGDAIAIEVSDDGMGISAELLPYVFDLFVQGERPLDRAAGGLGLGLALVQNLVHLHGGSVSAHSEGQGRGSRFTVRLAALSGPSASTSQQVAPAPAASRSKRVLVVDDNVDAAELMAELLKMSGHEPAVAHDGPQALRTLEHFDAAVAFLDIGLPAMDGYELASRIRARGLPIQLVALTGYGQAADLAKSRAAGFDRHLVKPVIAADALAAIESA